MKHTALKSIAALVSGAALVPASFAGDANTTTPIKHVIVVVGENNSFDTVFGTYIPPRGQSALNLLSQGIVKADGTPGANYSKAVQSQASNGTGSYTLTPTRQGPLAALPQPTLIGVYNPTTLTLYGTAPDPRFNGLTANGPFQISKYVPYGTATSDVGDPVHRFFQMWQQTGGTNEKHDLFQWVATTVGTGGATGGVTAASTGQGGELMGFYNMNQGDAPLFKSLAQQYAISDNYHQAVMGGTGANFFALATAGDAAVYNVNGVLATPPANEIENPDPQTGTDNFYTNDGYSGGSYVNCSDPSQPGVAEIHAVLAAKGRSSNCEGGAYYLVNNYTPAYDVYGNATAPTSGNFVYPPQTVPTIGELLSNNGVSWKWYTGGREDADVTSDPFYQLVYPQVFAGVKAKLPAGTPDSVIATYATPVAISKTRELIYNSIGDPLNVSTNVVNSALRNNLQGLTTLYADISNNTVPAVSFVVPKNIYSGHPGYSAPGNYELFLNDLITKVKANPALWAQTAILITTDEGGGYFDTGAIQNLDFFGDGPRIPLIAVSPFAKKGYVDHVYHDHVSIAKFIEKNWSLPTLSNRSRDNLPNPVKNVNNPYLPANQPAIGDLTSLFNF
ncbi:alkaline phosphatase family protein [Rhodoferax sp. GW822-FHT02A01]|uniref:alkaline phosphatase family protein n=1 Tax=Rhodoferax sp. GW822-FHT02A01 TaxID=3141537 RepID=UPI00315D1F73